MTIKEIAKMAGVSNAAVSRYLNNGYLSEEKRIAIQKVIEETGYRPSVQAQNLRTKKTKMIGVILPKIDSSSMGRMVMGIQPIIEEMGYQLLLANSQNSPDKELKYLELFDETRVDGIIFIATVITSEHKNALKECKVPVVILGQKINGYNCVYHDDYNAMREITSYIIGRGKKNIGYIGAIPQDVAVGKERYRGFCDELKEQGISFDEKNYKVADFTMESGYEMTKQLLENDRTIDGIVCVTDRIAVGALQYLKENGIKVPDEVEITGHGDSVMSKVADPVLTTVHYYYEESGQKAAEVLMKQLKAEDEPISAIIMGYTLVNL